VLTRKRFSWPRRVLVVAAIIAPSFFVGHGAQAKSYDVCVFAKNTSLFGITFKRLCIPLNLPA
jgi:hypothetical protein